MPTVAQASTFALQSLHAAAAASGNAYWRYILTIVCSPLDAGQADVMTNRNNRPNSRFSDTERQYKQNIKERYQWKVNPACHVTAIVSTCQTGLHNYCASSPA